MAGIADLFSNLGAAAASVFDGGIAAYKSVADRLVALNQINNDTVKAITPAAETPDPNLEASQKAMSTASMALVAAGILGVILIFLIIRRKTR